MPRKMMTTPELGSGVPVQVRSTDPRETEVEREIAKIERMSLIELRDAWLKRFGKAAPKLKGRDLLIRMLAFRLQADVFGDHSPAVKRKLAHLASVLANDPKAQLFPTPSLKPGIVLTREYRGVVHRVLVQTEGYLYDEKTYTSLTDIARTITGSNWSGPRFFGIEQRVRRQIKAKASAP